MHCFCAPSPSPLSEELVDVHANSGSTPVMTNVSARILNDFMTDQLLNATNHNSGFIDARIPSVADNDGNSRLVMTDFFLKLVNSE